MQAFVGHRSLYIEASEPGLVVPVFLFDLDPQGLTLTFLLVVSTAEEKVGGVDLVLGLDTGQIQCKKKKKDLNLNDLSSTECLIHNGTLKTFVRNILLIVDVL